MLISTFSISSITSPFHSNGLLSRQCDLTDKNVGGISDGRNQQARLYLRHGIRDARSTPSR